MRPVIALALVALVVGCAEPDPPELWLAMDQTLTLGAIDAHVGRWKAYEGEKLDSERAEAWRASLQGWYYKEVAHDTTAARAAYERARMLGHPTAALALVGLDLGPAWNTEFSYEESLVWLRGLKRFADEGDSVALEVYTQHVETLQAEQAIGNTQADTLLVMWEAHLYGTAGA